MGKNSMKEVARRLEYIDLMKGLGALLVVIGHMKYADFSDIITKFIYGFHMPMFFWISGYLYKKPSSFFGYVIKKAKALLLPWVFFGVLYLLITLLSSGIHAFLSGVVGLFVKVVRDVPVEIGLWFLPVMFMTSVVYALVDLHTSHNWIKNMLLVLMTIVGCEWTKLFHYLPFGISSMLPCVGFFAFGAWFHEKADKKMKEYINLHEVLSVIISALSIAIFGCLIMLNDRISVRMGEYGIPILGWLNAVALTVSLFVLSFNVCERNVSSESRDMIITPITWLGTASIIVLCVNHPMLNISMSILKMVGLETDSLMMYVVHFVLAMALIVASIWVFKLTPLKRIVGWK